jgi:two-component system chemotaxis response regulator CheY
VDIESPQLILESLDSIETRLLGMESASCEGVDPLGAIHLLFRELHNLKSALSLGSADTSAKLIHQAESCADMLRSGKGDPESNWVDLLLAVIDHVRKGMEAGEETEAPALAEQLDGVLEKWLHLETPNGKKIGFPLDETEMQGLQEAIMSGRKTYIIEKLVGEGLDSSAVKSLPVFDSLNEAGSLIAWNLKREKGSFSVLSIVFASDKATEDLSFIIFDPFYPVIGSGQAELGKKAEADCAENDKMNRILIVDDEPIAMMLLQNYLCQFGRIDTAQTGQEALEKFTKAYIGREPYDVVFLDIMMPGIPGDSVLEGMRKFEHEAGIPEGNGTRIIMESSLGDYPTISASFHKQCDAYLVKPIDALAVDKTMVKLGFPKSVIPFAAIPKSGQMRKSPF